MTNARLLIVLTLVLSILAGCEHTTTRSAVPSYPVHMELNIEGEYPHFRPNGQVSTMVFLAPRFPNEAVGYAGLLVFTAMDEKYHACDLCCPKCLKRDMPVEVDGMFATCPGCGEQFDISYGYCTPSKGIAKEALRLYNAYYAGGKLIIN